ncbi:class I SAM-dependent methyltransferase [Candidatus Pyrohabitans sp.]
MQEKRLARKLFNARAEGYAGGCFASDEHLEAMLIAGKPGADSLCLDVACGHGFLTEALATRAKFAVGVDITERMLPEKGKACYLVGDAEHLPFRDETFDLVASRFSFHHFPSPELALAEIHRMLKRGSNLVLADGISSEVAEKSHYLNRLEKLRDPSHVRLYKKSELLRLLVEGGFSIAKVFHWELHQELEDWLSRAAGGKSLKARLREIMRGELEENRTGLIFWEEGDKTYFAYQTVIIVATKQFLK